MEVSASAKNGNSREQFRNRGAEVSPAFIVASAGIGSQIGQHTLQQTLQQEPHLSHLGELVDALNRHDVDRKRSVVAHL